MLEFNVCYRAALDTPEDGSLAKEYVKGLLAELDRQALTLSNLHLRYRHHNDTTYAASYVAASAAVEDLENSTAAKSLRDQEQLAIANGDAQSARFYRLERIKLVNRVFV